MAAFKWLLVFLAGCCIALICADDIDRVGRKGAVLKLLRDMVNQTKADTLNLPANATSIRENITDTFSCENRTYGYYADVDNDCQVFHVCLTSQTATGRNVTYRWSFICPKETVFNQEVLTCTRPRDAINCEDSPMFYHLNMDIGKIPNENETQASPNETTSPSKNQRRKPMKKQNLIVENLLNEVKKENLILENFDPEIMPVVEVDIDEAKEDTIKKKIEAKQKSKEEIKKKPVVHEVNEEFEVTGKRMDNSRLSTERSLKRKGRKIGRGSFRFKTGRI